MQHAKRLPGKRTLTNVRRTLKRAHTKAWNIWDAYHLKEITDTYSFGDGYKSIYHYHIKKSGGTSLNHLFFSTASSFHSAEAQMIDAAVVYEILTRQHRLIRDDKILVAWNKALIETGRYFYAHSHIPQHNLRLPGTTFTLTCLRDPVKRMISRYNQLMYYKEFAVPHPAMKKMHHWLGNTFSDFLDRVPRDELLVQLYMFSKTYDGAESFENICRCSYFFLTEDFAHGVNELSARLGVPLEPVHIRKADKRYPVTDAEMERLREMLKPEYALYEQVAAEYYRRKGA
jgi:hypothetical protein